MSCLLPCNYDTLNFNISTVHFDNFCWLLDLYIVNNSAVKLERIKICSNKDIVVDRLDITRQPFEFVCHISENNSNCKTLLISDVFRVLLTLQLNFLH